MSSVKTTGRRKVLTAQGIFDYVYKFIVNQGMRAIAANGSCSYRTTDYEGDGRVLCCAAGCLLTDEEAKGLDSMYDVDTGQYTTQWTDIVKKGRAPARFAEFTDLIAAMQLAHDSARTADFVISFTEIMCEVAIKFGLLEPTR